MRSADIKRTGAARATRSRRAVAVAAAVAAAAALPGGPAARAATRQYIGGAGTTNWNSFFNWNLPVVPVGGDDANLTFGDVNVRTINYDYTGPAVTLSSVSVGSSALLPTTLSISANTLTVGHAVVGNNGIGTVTQSGGTFGVTGALDLGGAVGGTFNLSGGTFTVAGQENVGNTGFGTFTQSGGTNNAQSLLDVGIGGTGTYNLNSGVLNAGSVDIAVFGSNGTFNNAGGTQTSGGIRVGSFGTGGVGTVNVSAGTVNTGAVLLGGIGADAVAVGVLNSTGGSLTAGGGITIYNAAVGTNTSRMTINGGTVSTTFISAPDWNQLAFFKGTLSLTGGTSNNPGTLAVGLSGAATLNVSGGSHTAGTSIVVSQAPGCSLNVSGGFLTTPMLEFDGPAKGTLSSTGVLNVNGEEAVGPGSAVFTQTGGTNNIFGALTVSGSGSYAMQSGTLASSYGEYVGYASGAGTSVLNQSGGSNSMAVLLSIATVAGTTGTVNLSGGTMTVPNVSVGGNFGTASGGVGLLNVTGGSLSATNISVLNASSLFTLNGGTVTTAAIFTTPNWGRVNFVKGTLNLTGGVSSNAGDLNIGNGPGASTLNLLGGALTVGILTAGIDAGSNSTINQSGGTHTLTELRLGYANSNVAYNLSGTGSLAVSANAYVGYIAGATMTQTGGSFTPNVLYVGYNPGVSATYALSGTGTLTAPAESVGVFGTGVVNQSGGSNTITGANGLALGGIAGGTGTYNLSGGTFATPGAYVGGTSGGAGGGGTLNVNGGTMTVPAAGVVKVWNSNGAVTIDGGTLSTGRLELPNWFHLTFNSGTLNLTGGASSTGANLLIGNAVGTATLNLSAGSLTVTTANTGGDEYVGFGSGSTGAVAQSGGTHTVAGALHLGEYSDTTGNYTLTAGTLTTGLTYVGYGGRSTFTHSAGAHNPGRLDVGVAPGLGPGATGTYALSGAGALTVAQVETVGYGGIGAFNQTGGTHVINGTPGLQLGVDAAFPAAGNGTFNLSGGTLTTPNAYLGGSESGANTATGALNVSGGTMTVAGTVKVWTATSTVALTGTGVLAAGSLDLPAGVGPAAMLTLNGGTWRHTGASAAMNHAFTVGANGGVIDVTTAASVLTLGGTSTGAGQLSKQGPGTLKVTGSLASVARLTVTAGKLDAAAAQTLKSLGVNDGAGVVVSAGALKVGDNVSIGPLGVGSTGKIDLGTRGMIVDVPAAAVDDTLVTVRGLIVQGYHATGAGNNGDWAGAGVTSAAAAANSSRAVGYARAADVFNVADATPDLFLGTAVDASAVVTRLTLAGDATMDGTVDFNDLVRLAQNYNTAVSVAPGVAGSWWFNGDFTYDGVVDFNDLVKLAQNYNTALPADPVPGAAVGFNHDLAAAFASVPEPSGIGVVAIVGCGFAARRRRRRQAPSVARR